MEGGRWKAKMQETNSKNQDTGIKFQETNFRNQDTRAQKIAGGVRQRAGVRRDCLIPFFVSCYLAS